MVKDDSRRAREVVDGALALPLSERAAFIQARTANDTDLRNRIHRLLAQADTTEHDQDSLQVTGGALRAVPGLRDELRPDLTGKKLGRYSVVGEIGLGENLRVRAVLARIQGRNAELETFFWPAPSDFSPVAR